MKRSTKHSHAADVRFDCADRDCEKGVLLMGKSIRHDARGNLQDIRATEIQWAKICRRGAGLPETNWYGGPRFGTSFLVRKGKLEERQ
jgi:hypothetical protein